MWAPSFFPRVTTWLQTGISNVQYEFRPLHIFALVGILVVLYVVERAFDFVFFHFATPREALQGYKRRGPKPTYALIAGAGAGIGLGVAKALVKQGFGVIILGDNKDDLAEAANALRGAVILPEDADPTKIPLDDYVKTIVMDAMTATPEEMEQKLRTTIIDPGLRVSILVNNAGPVPVTQPPFREIATYSPDDIDNTIALNVRFPTMLTTLLLPVLTHRGSGVDAEGISFGTHRRSLILNLSSGGMIGLPYLVLYGATKAFNWSFTKGLAREMEAHPSTNHVDVLSVLPGDTQSQGNTFRVSKWVPDADRFGECIVEKTDGAIGRGWREMYPFWLHHLQAIAQGVASDKTVSKQCLNTMKLKRNEWEAQQAIKHD